MAGKHGVLLEEDLTLVAATVRTVIQLEAGTNHPIDVTEVGVGFDGTDSTKEAVEVLLVRQSTVGTSVAGSIVGANDSDGDTFGTAAWRGFSGVEPTTGDVLRKWRVHPQTGFVYQPSDDAPIHVGAGDRIAIVCNPGFGVDVDAYINFTE